MRARLPMRQEPGRASARAARLPGARPHHRFQRHPEIAGHRCRRRGHAGLDALRPCEGRALERQARVRREALHLEFTAGRGTHRAGVPEEPADHGGSHLSLQRCRAEDSSGRRRRHARTALLLRLDAREPGPLPARRQRDLGPGAARSVDHGLRDRRAAGRRRRHRGRST